ncbi:hypothetical protein JQN58_04705 [Aneurinibacillus sp. BA2021]|nr:hypothetical protein [Aneurinibacillus sp. BA2021]
MIKLLLGIIVFIVVLGLIFTLLLVGGVATIARKFMGRGSGYSSRSYGHRHYKKHKYSSMSFFSS